MRGEDDAVAARQVCGGEKVKTRTDSFKASSSGTSRPLPVSLSFVLSRALTPHAPPPAGRGPLGGEGTLQKHEDTCGSNNTLNMVN
eukprot:scaffold2765_cov328-Prasinococcus_capsulatus_cf.AAC.1